VGLVLTTATQLRPSTSSIGIGEVLLSLWLALSSIALIARRRFDPAPMVKILIVFWIVALAALTCGFISHSSLVDVDSLSHDSLAILFVALVSLSFVGPDGLVLRFQRTLVLVLSLSILPLLFLWAIGLVWQAVGPLNLWYYYRFAGWAENPNQLALAMAPAPFLGIYLATVLRTAGKWWSVCLALAAVWIGLASYSDALRVSWLASGFFLLVLAWCRLAVRGRKDPRSALVAYGGIPVGAVVVAIAAGPTIMNTFTEFGNDVYEEGDQGLDRLTAWQNGFNVILESPVFGRGPGGHSGGYLSPEPAEAHNTFIDWGSNSGLVGLAAYVGLLTWATAVVWRHGNSWLMATLVALTVFSLFNYVLRQPIYWYYLLASIALSSDGTHQMSRDTRRILEVSSDSSCVPLTKGQIRGTQPRVTVCAG
jgi:O-antigen ligase